MSKATTPVRKKVDTHAEVQDRMDYRVPHAMYWTINQVAEWIADIGFPQYQECFVSNFVNGRKLILMNGSTLPSIGIQDFDHIKYICDSIQKLIEVEAVPWDHPIGKPPSSDLGLYMETKVFRGEYRDKLTYSKFLEKKEEKKWKPPLGNVGIMLRPEPVKQEMDWTPKSSRLSYGSRGGSLRGSRVSLKLSKNRM